MFSLTKSFLQVFVLGVVLSVASTAWAQSTCPAGYPQDCGDGTCAPYGTQCCGDGTHAPSGADCCGGGTYCDAGSYCSGGGCVTDTGGSCPSSSDVDCGDGTCAPYGAQCCGDGTHCSAGSYCAAGGGCLIDSGSSCPSSSDVNCGDGTCAPYGADCCGGGIYCAAGSYCAAGGGCVSDPGGSSEDPDTSTPDVNTSAWTEGDYTCVIADNLQAGSCDSIGFCLNSAATMAYYKGDSTVFRCPSVTTEGIADCAEQVTEYCSRSGGSGDSSSSETPWGDEDGSGCSWTDSPRAPTGSLYLVALMLAVAVSWTRRVRA